MAMQRPDYTRKESRDEIWERRTRKMIRRRRRRKGRTSLLLNPA